MCNDCIANNPATLRFGSKNAFHIKQQNAAGSKPVQKASPAIKEQAKKQEGNSAWGPIFKNKQNFTEMHMW